MSNDDNRFLWADGDVEITKDGQTFQEGDFYVPAGSGQRTTFDPLVED